MDRYKEEVDQVVPETLSRENKNKNIYEEVYMNASYVSIENIMNDSRVEEEKEDIPESFPNEEENYIEKSYDVNDYLQKAHEKHINDNAMRNINDEEFQERESEIRKLIADIDEKEKETDFLQDLRGNNEDTLIGGKLKTDEFDLSIYSALMDDEKGKENNLLDHALSDETLVNMENAKLDNTFEKILQSDKKGVSKLKKLPVIVFFITLFLLIAVIVIILLFK